jgi:hypothetical protein
MSKSSQIIDDLRFIYNEVPVEGLRNLRDNRDRLVRGAYRTPAGGGCLMYLLTEHLPADQRIDSKKALTRYFGGDPLAPRYQPARFIVRLWDGQVCSEVRDRYGRAPRLDEETVFQVLDQVLAERLPVLAAEKIAGGLTQLAASAATSVKRKRAASTAA